MGGIVVSRLFLARKFRAEADRCQILTCIDYSATKFPRQGTGIRLLATLIIVFYVIYVYA